MGKGMKGKIWGNEAQKGGWGCVEEFRRSVMERNLRKMVTQKATGDSRGG